MSHSKFRLYAHSKLRKPE